MEVAIYKDFGCFPHALEKQYKHRDNPELIKEIREAHKKGKYKDIKIVTIPDDLKNYIILDYDGKEFIVDPERIWK